MWFSNLRTIDTESSYRIYRSFVYKRKIESGMQCFVTPWCNNAIYQQSLITRVCCEAVRSAILATAWLLVITKVPLPGFDSFKWMNFNNLEINCLKNKLHLVFRLHYVQCCWKIMNLSIFRDSECQAMQYDTDWQHIQHYWYWKIYSTIS